MGRAFCYYFTQYQHNARRRHVSRKKPQTAQHRRSLGAFGTQATKAPGQFLGGSFSTPYPPATARRVAAPQTRASPCALSLDRATAVVSPNVTVAAGVASMANGTLFNLGQRLSIRAYAVRGGNLTVCDFMANNCFDNSAGVVGNPVVWVPVANNIVSLRAEYGSDTTAPMDGVVDVYNQTTPTTACGWVKTPAIRVALVARSGQFEKDEVTSAAPTWAGTASATSVPIDLSANASWKNYRYKVFETTIPIRNVAWMGVITGC